VSLVAFEDSVRAHFSHPPHAWQIQRSHEDYSWNIVDVHGAILESCPAKAQAEERRCSGPAAAQWQRRTDWYLGNDAHGRALTPVERLIVSEVIELIGAADEAFHRARVVKPVQLAGQGADDDRIWDAARLADGRYQLRGDYFCTYGDADLVFLDKRAIATVADFEGFLRDLLNPPKRRNLVGSQ